MDINELAKLATQLPWRITEPNERKGREIGGADGATVAKLTALDMDNADLIVASVNAIEQLQRENTSLRLRLYADTRQEAMGASYRAVYGKKEDE